MAAQAAWLVSLVLVGGLRVGHGLQVAADGKYPNLCMNGHVVPEFYLLGTQCSGTSSLSEELAVHPDLAFPTLLDHKRDPFRYFEKELHIFDKVDRYAWGMEFWTNHYPKCSETPNRTIAVDATPNYLFIEPDYVPLQLMAQRYGSHKADLKFVIQLREPFARMHSAFWHYNTQNAYMCEDKFTSFAARVLADTANITTLDEYWLTIRRSHADPFIGSLYPSMLKVFFDNFDARQLTIVPMRYFTEPKEGEGKVANAIISGVLGLAELPVEEELWRGGVAERHLGTLPPVINNHKHPTPEQELDAPTLKALEEVMERYAGARATADVLATQPQVNLHQYDGKKEMSSIAYWLDKHW